MKQALPFFILLVLCSCRQTSNRTGMQQNNGSAGSVTADTSATREKAERQPTELTAPAWEKHEDSLRKTILRKKENKVIGESFLQEMYIRNVVTVLGDSLFLTIPFNLHGPDCGAPDCYSTDVSFGFKFGDALVFPKNIRFLEHEHGCVDRERKRSGNFQLAEETRNHVIYHSAEQKSTLVLFRSKKENATMAYYFTGVEKNRINGKNVCNIVKNYDEEDPNSIYPLTNWVLTTNEYEHFVR